MKWLHRSTFLRLSRLNRDYQVYDSHHKSAELMIDITNSSLCAQRQTLGYGYNFLNLLLFQLMSKEIFFQYIAGIILKLVSYTSVGKRFAVPRGIKAINYLDVPVKPREDIPFVFFFFSIDFLSKDSRIFHTFCDLRFDTVRQEKARFS